MREVPADDWPERERALGVIGRIYDGALDPQAWTRVMGEVVQFVGATKGILFTPLQSPQQGGYWFPHLLPESSLQMRAGAYAEHDIWNQALIARGDYYEGNSVLGQALVPEEQFLQSVFYREFLKPLGIARLCAGIVFGNNSPGTLPTVCSTFRDVSDPPFGSPELDRMRVLVPHLSRALGIMYRLRDAELKVAASFAALDRIASGVLLLDSRGQVAHANRAAKRVLEHADGLKLRALRPGERGGKLLADDAQARASIENALAECLRPDAIQVAHFSCGVSVPRASGARPYVLQLAPLPRTNEFRTESTPASAIAFLTDPDAPPDLDEALLRRLYALTASEARLAILLCAGEPLAGAAARLGVSEETARTHLKHVFGKTGTHRQAELVKLLLALGSTRP